MKRSVLVEVSAKTDNDLSEFFGEMHLHKIVDNYNISIVPDPVYYYRQDFIDEVVNHGFNSMLNFSITMDDITTPGMHVDEIESVFNRFVEKLCPSSHLIIIDPYFYPNKDIKTTADTFIRLIKPIISNLTKLTVVFNGANKPYMDEFNNVLLAENSSIEISTHISKDFHDRFWINPDENKGMVVGTSLNGIGKKISLVDSLSSSDVCSLLSALKSCGVNYNVEKA